MWNPLPWRISADSILNVWDGDDRSFPTIKKFPGAPLWCTPALSEAMFHEGTLESEVAIAAWSKPLDGMSRSLIWLSESQEREFLELTPRSHARTVRQSSKGFWLLRIDAAFNKIRLLFTSLTPDILYESAPPWLSSDALAYRVLSGIHNSRMLETRFRWSATFKKSIDHIGIRIPTDAVGVLEMLKDREKKSGARRLPLLHWVREHARKNRSSDDAHLVREHIRGQRRCEWRGYLVEIRESESEREKIMERNG